MRIAIDTNLWLYLLIKGQDEEKAKAFQNALAIVQRPVIPSQVVVECVANMIKKAHCGADDIRIHVENILSCGEIITRDKEVIQKTVALYILNMFSWWDSLIVSAALISDCDKLLTEDMQHGQVIEGKLKIVNPFKYSNTIANN